MATDNAKIVAEISIIPVGKNSQNDDTMPTSMSKEIAVAFNAIKKVKDIKVNLTAMGTEIETSSIENVLEAVKTAHNAVKDIGIKRIISIIRIDERLDKLETLEDRIKSVNQKLLSTTQ